MTFTIDTRIEIKGSPEKIWEVLTDFKSYPEWNPFIWTFEGRFEKGEVVNVDIQGMQFKPTILDIEDGKSFRWIGHLYFKGLFDGEHIFKIIYKENSETSELIHMEKFSGILLLFLKKKLDTDTRKGFKAMNLALKKRVESLNEG